MPYGESGGQIDEASRKRLNELMGFLPPPQSEAEALGQKIADIRKQLEGEAEMIDGEVQEITRADIFRRAYSEKNV